MSRMMMMCGPADPGKSTVARRFEAVGTGRGVVLDLSFWLRAMREANHPFPIALLATNIRG